MCINWEVIGVIGSWIGAISTLGAAICAWYFAHVQCKLNKKSINIPIIKQYSKHYIKLTSFVRKYILSNIAFKCMGYENIHIQEEYEYNRKQLVAFHEEFTAIYYESQLLDSNSIKQINKKIFNLLNSIEINVLKCISGENNEQNRTSIINHYFDLHNLINQTEIIDAYKQSILELSI